MVEIAPEMASPPVEKMAPRSGVSSVVPQVGQPAPRAMSPVIMPAFSRLAVLEVSFWWRFLSQRRTIRPMRTPWSTQMAKIGSQSKKGWLTPKMARKLLLMICRFAGKPSAPISSNLENPP